MTVLAEVTDALHDLRVSFVQSLVNVAARRIKAKGKDHGPVLINVSGSTMGIRTMIDEVGQILGLERLYIDITSDGQSFELSQPAGADIDRPDMRFVVLDGWRNDRARASIYLRDNLTSIFAANNTILIILANFDDPHDLDDDVGPIIGNALWREVSHIFIETPDFLKSEDTQDFIRSAREAAAV